MRIIDLDSLPAEKLVHFPVFFQKAYLKYQEDETIHCVIVTDEEGNMVPLRLYKKAIFKTAQFLYAPMGESGRLSLSDEKLFIFLLVSFLKKNGYDALLAPLHVCLFQHDYNVSNSKRLGILFVSLEYTSEIIFSKFSRTYRTQIRQCEKEGFTLSTSEEYLEVFFENFKKHHIRQGKTYEDFDKIKKMLCLMPQYCKLMSVINGQGKWEGSVLLLFDSQTGYYFYGSKDEENHTHNGSQKFLHWKIMLFLKEFGIMRYNLGGYRFGLDAADKFQSIQDFKVKFGSLIEEGYHFTITLSPKFKLFNFLIRLKQLIK
jgi:lipid II:glycine glycyltransferase (peptidoglycan interpeptide bridge formation enzyme)